MLENAKLPILISDWYLFIKKMLWTKIKNLLRTERTKKKILFMLYRELSTDEIITSWNK